jgi:UDP-N-acetylglucosamine 2-epimerase
MARVLFIAGTRPEAIKLCPVLLRMRRSTHLETRLCVTGQHRGLLDQALEAFGVVADHDLALMTESQTLPELTARVLTGLDAVLEQEHPDMVVVQGDTTTTFAGALAGFYAKVPVAHVEAGLRTGDPFRPFPEEMNRVLTTRLASLHFAPTEKAAANLRSEGTTPEQIFVTGNSGIDALLHVRDALASGELQVKDPISVDAGKRLLLVTAHRRESFGLPLLGICAALKEISLRADIQIVWPLHPNPSISKVVRGELAGFPNIVLEEALSYVRFVDLMTKAHVLLTDSGGIQEEGPSLGKPVLVLRQETERPEAVEAGTAEIVGSNPLRIVQSVERLLNDSEEYLRRTIINNPYGDGRAGERISNTVEKFLNAVPKLS